MLSRAVLRLTLYRLAMSSMVKSSSVMLCSLHLAMELLVDGWYDIVDVVKRVED